MSLPKWFQPNGISTYIRVPFNKCAYVIKFRRFYSPFAFSHVHDRWRVCAFTSKRDFSFAPFIIIFFSFSCSVHKNRLWFQRPVRSQFSSFPHRFRRQSNWNDFIKFCRFLPCYPLRLNIPNIPHLAHTKTYIHPQIVTTNITLHFIFIYIFSPQ